MSTDQGGSDQDASAQDGPSFDGPALDGPSSSGLNADGVALVVSASRTIGAEAEVIFELIADPSHQPRWDGNDNLGEATAGQRVRSVGDVFVMILTGGKVRENHVVEFDEGRLIAWRPSEPGSKPPGHLWRWELEPQDGGTTHVTHTYDWSQLTDEKRFGRARQNSSVRLAASIERLAALAEGAEDQQDAQDFGD